MPKPTGRHSDWPWPLSLIPRSWNSWSSETEPVKILGNATGHLDVPGKGQWAIAGVARIPVPVFFAVQTSSGLYVRLALIRYDYHGRYYTWPSFALKRYA